MSRVFRVQRTLHGFQAKNKIRIPVTVVLIGAAKADSYIFNENEDMLVLALELCSRIKAERITYELCWIVECGMAAESALRCSVTVNAELTDEYILLGMLAGVIALCALEEKLGGGDVNMQNTMYSQVYTVLAEDYQKNGELRKTIAETLSRLSLEAE